jgi:hypothetical protein
VGVETTAAQLSRRGVEHVKDDTRRAQVAEARHVVLAVGVDHRVRVRQLLVGLVMVDDDDVAAELAGTRQGLAARRTAVDGDDEARAFPDQAFDGTGIRPVPFEQPVGDVDPRRPPWCEKGR